MAWNEPTGGSNKPKDPWGGNNSNQGPPDLDEALKKLQAKLQGLLVVAVAVGVAHPVGEVALPSPARWWRCWWF